MYKFVNGKKIMIPKNPIRAFEVSSAWLPGRITIKAKNQTEAIDKVIQDFDAPDNVPYAVRPLM